MRIVVIADVHEDEDVLESIILEESPDFVLDCGDHDFDPISTVQRYIIHGNHEEAQMLLEAERYHRRQITDGVYLLPSGEVLTLQKNGCGLKVAGLGGNFSAAVYGQYRTRKKADEAGKQLFIVEEEVKRMQNARADVLLFHEPPGILGFENEEGGKLLDYIVAMIKPKIVFSGHVHTYREAEDNEMRFISLPVLRDGYAIMDCNCSAMNVGMRFNNKDYFVTNGVAYFPERSITRSSQSLCA